MRCTNCGKEILSQPGNWWAHRATGQEACDYRPMATPSPEGTPNVTPVDGR